MEEIKKNLIYDLTLNYLICPLSYLNVISLQAVVLEADWKISDISDKILSGGDVTAELSELEETLTDTLKHSNIGVALRSELLIRLGWFSGFSIFVLEPNHVVFCVKIRKFKII